MTWKIFALWKFEILGVFLNTLLMISVLFEIVKICSSLFLCNYVKNKKIFLNFFSIYEISIKY